jgi:hypothetical protein
MRSHMFKRLPLKRKRGGDDDARNDASSTFETDTTTMRGTSLDVERPPTSLSKSKIKKSMQKQAPQTKDSDLEDTDDGIDGDIEAKIVPGKASGSMCGWTWWWWEISLGWNEKIHGAAQNSS